MQSSPELSEFPLHKAVTEKELNTVKQQIQDGNIELPDGSDEKLLDERINLLKRFLEETGVICKEILRLVRLPWKNYEPT